MLERKHKHVLETAKALFFQSKFSKSYWNECILTTIYLINRFPSSVLHNKSPYEILFNHKSSYTNLKVFGCLCFISTLKRQIDKFQNRAYPSIFIGYAYNPKAYKVLDLDSNKIVITHDVTFHENCFPFHNIVSPNSHITMPFPVSDFSTLQFLVDFPITLPIVQYASSLNDSSSPLSTGFHAPHSSSSSSSSSSSILPRRFAREHKSPTYLQDYICNSATSSFPFSHWCNLIAFNHLLIHSQAHIAPLQNFIEPTSYNQASQDPNWIAAMHKEINALTANHTWDIVTLPKGKKPIGCKWVYKIKLKVDGSLEIYGERLVAKGYTQKEGVDYFDTFSHVVKMMTIRAIIVAATYKGWDLFQLDVNNAFLHGDLHEKVYMQCPQGVSHSPNQVCRLQKSLYGLKQASRQWFAKLREALRAKGYIQSKNDYSLFLKTS